MTAIDGCKIVADSDSNINRMGIKTVIVNYNAGEYLADCIGRILPMVDQVVVVDNKSSDNSLKILENSFSDKAGVSIIRNHTNLGFSAACNIGIQYEVDTPFVLFLNPDCLVETNTLNELLNTIMSDTTIGMLGGLLLNPDGREQAGGRRTVPTPWRSFIRAFGLARFANRWPRLFSDFDLLNKPLPKQPIEVEAISGACMLVRREAIEDVGLWDEGYFLHCEDLDWCMRFRQKGWKVMFVPTAKMVHVQGVSSKNRKLFVEWHKHKGMMRFYRKFFRHQYPGGLMWLVAAGVWLRFGMIASDSALRKLFQGMGILRE